jgi:hypothetical protein
MSLIGTWRRLLPRSNLVVFGAKETLSQACRVGFVSTQASQAIARHLSKVGNLC